jgi:alkylation response protein AidB-like acyl-CoA dehydrogenase
MTVRGRGGVRVGGVVEHPALGLLALLAALLGAVALGTARAAIDTLVSMGVDKRHVRTGQSICEEPGAQSRLAQTEALVQSARLYLYDAVSRLWDEVPATVETSVAGRAHGWLAMCHAVSSAVQAVDLVYLTGGATSLYARCPIERAFRDVYAVTQHIGVHPRNLEAVGRVLFGLEPPPGMLTA